MPLYASHICYLNKSIIKSPSSPSLDGVPFLMRDRTLRRTTNVQRLFPQRQSDDASLFTWTQLRSLNAGLWFLKVRALSQGWQISQLYSLKAGLWFLKVRALSSEETPSIPWCVSVRYTSNEAGYSSHSTCFCNVCCVCNWCFLHINSIFHFFGSHLTNWNMGLHSA